MEFAHEKEVLFDRWCSAKDVNSQAKMRELMLVDEFKNCTPMAVSTYLNEHQLCCPGLNAPGRVSQGKQVLGDRSD